VLSTGIGKSSIQRGVQVASAAYNLGNGLRLPMLVENMERLRATIQPQSTQAPGQIKLGKMA
jgi:hypothetical protein